MLLVSREYLALIFWPKSLFNDDINNMVIPENYSCKESTWEMDSAILTSSQLAFSHQVVSLSPYYKCKALLMLQYVTIVIGFYCQVSASITQAQNLYRRVMAPKTLRP